VENSDDYAAHFELIARVSAGDMDAYDAMYRQYVAGATRVARTVANSTSESTDVVFEAFARLLVRLRETGEPAVGIEEYLRATIRRLAIERHPDVTQGDVQPPHPDALIGTDDRFMRVRQAYEALPDEWQQILWHAEVERKPQLALSKGLEMSQSAVASLVLRSREGLRQAYGAIALGQDMDDACHDYAPNIPVHVKGMLPDKVGKELGKHLRRCDTCRKFRDDYVLLLSDLRPTLFGALLRPADPSAVPAVTSAAAANDVGGPAAAVMGVDDEATREVPITDSTTESAAPAAMIGGITATEVEEATRRDRRRRGILVGAVAGLAAATVFAAFSWIGGGPSDRPPSAGDGGYSDGSVGLAGGGNALGGGLADGPTVAVLSESAEDDATGDSVFAAGDDGAAGQNAGDEGHVDDTQVGDPPAPILPGPGDSPSSRPSSSPEPSPSSTRGWTPKGEPDIEPSFLSHPKSVSAEPGQTVTFAVEVDGKPDPKLKWQRRTSASGSWSNVANSASVKLQVTVSASMDGHLYRAVATNDLGTEHSNPATLSVKFPAPEVTKHPNDAEAPKDGGATFKASAASDSDPAFTDVWWEERVDGAWSRMSVDVPAAENTSLTLTDVQNNRNGAQFRAVFANEFGKTATNPATLTVTDS
jgi:RNA polymerase sigma factor (sigma-70 family)